MGGWADGRVGVWACGRIGESANGDGGPASTINHRRSPARSLPVHRCARAHPSQVGLFGCSILGLVKQGIKARKTLGKRVLYRGRFGTNKCIQRVEIEILILTGDKAYAQCGRLGSSAPSPSRDDLSHEVVRSPHNCCA
ncbi:MAG: hypothetical protein FJ279_16635 [Planctomycetes bacterium]|nr:hypothetical protein [Planctomycetota bacterium]